MRLRLMLRGPTLLLMMLALACSSETTSPVDDAVGPDVTESDTVHFADLFSLGDTSGFEDSLDFDFALPPEVQSETLQEMVTAPDLTGEDASLTDTVDVVESGDPLAPFQAFSAGGGALASPNYRLQLYLSPVRPVARTGSPNYRMTLGPASFWRAE